MKAQRPHQTLGDRRATCAHARLIELSFRVSRLQVHAHRWCLDCGDEEKISDPNEETGAQTYRRLADGQVIDAYECRSEPSYAGACGFNHQHLYLEGGVHRYDASGKWIRDSDENPAIVRGTD